jgi:predicted short-subunit dehydrogenase-like oxidoreductase (DUF2520 family)
MIPERDVLAGVAIVGLGRLGCSLKAALSASGVDVLGLSGRDTVAARAVPKGLESVSLLVITVPDDALPTVAAALARSVSAAGSSPCVLHASGALDSSVLSPFAALGLPTGSCHPMQSFPDLRPRPAAFRDITFGLEGDERAREAGRLLADRLGARWVEIDARHKPLYHLAAVLAGNAVVGLAAAARDAMVAAGLTSPEALAALSPLAHTALDAAFERGPEAALSGPVARNDLTTLERHREAIRRWDPSRLPLYDALVREQERLGRA